MRQIAGGDPADGGKNDPAFPWQGLASHRNDASSQARGEVGTSPDRWRDNRNEGQRDGKTERNGGSGDERRRGAQAPKELSDSSDLGAQGSIGLHEQHHGRPKIVNQLRRPSSSPLSFRR